MSSNILRGTIAQCSKLNSFDLDLDERSAKESEEQFSANEESSRRVFPSRSLCWIGKLDLPPQPLGRNQEERERRSGGGKLDLAKRKKKSTEQVRVPIAFLLHSLGLLEHIPGIPEAQAGRL